MGRSKGSKPSVCASSVVNLTPAEQNASGPAAPQPGGAATGRCRRRWLISGGRTPSGETVPMMPKGPRASPRWTLPAWARSSSLTETRSPRRAACRGRQRRKTGKWTQRRDGGRVRDKPWQRFHSRQKQSPRRKICDSLRRKSMAVESGSTEGACSCERGTTLCGNKTE